MKDSDPKKRVLEHQIACKTSACGELGKKMNKEIQVFMEYAGEVCDSYDMVELVEYYHVELGVDLDEIVDIQPSFVDIPGYVYMEFGVARETHPAAGSFGVDVILRNGSKAQFQNILYHDRNPLKTHDPRLPHWNQEFRIIDIFGTERYIRRDKVKIVNHSLPDSSYLNVCCLGPDGKPNKIVVNRDDFRPIRT